MKARKQQSTKSPNKTGPIVVRFLRHRAGPPRRAPGQCAAMSPAQIASERLVEGTDYERVH